MAQNSVDIEVHLKGAEAAKKGLSSIGQSAGDLAGKFDQTNSHLGEGLSQVTDNISELGGSFKDLGSTISSIGKSGGASFMALLPAIGGVVAAGITLYQTFQMITGAAQRAEDAQEAAAGAAADLQSKLEALAEKGIRPTSNELLRFSQITLKAQLAKARLEKTMETTKEIQEEFIETDSERIEKLKELKTVNDQLTASLEKTGIIDTKLISQRTSLTKELLTLEKERDEQQKRFKDSIERSMPAQRQLQKILAEAAESEAELESRGAEATLGRVKELATRLESLKLAKAEGEQQGTALELQKTYIAEEKEALLARLEANKENARALLTTEKSLQKQIDAYDQQKVLAEKFGAQRVAIYEKQSAEIQAADKTRFDRLQALRQKALVEAHQIRLLEIEQMKLQGATTEQVLDARYEADIVMAQNNAKAKIAVNLRYENERIRLQAEADAKAETERKRLEAQRQQFIFESQAFDISMMENGLDRELSALELKYRKERELKERTEEELTELTRRYNIEREAIEQRSINSQIERASELTKSLGAGFVEASYSALVFGDSFKDSVAQIIGGLGKQAAVEALIETAKGIAASVLNPAAASAHFASAAQFGVAATFAGLASASMGGGGGGGGGGGVSPTGSPQIAPTPEREQAQESSMVFNINFGGAVIYDTKASAEQALADRITNLQNVQRRGAPRRRF
jgi:hypothetical protein